MGAAPTQKVRATATGAFTPFDYAYGIDGKSVDQVKADRAISEQKAAELKLLENTPDLTSQVVRDSIAEGYRQTQLARRNRASSFLTGDSAFTNQGLNNG